MHARVGSGRDNIRELSRPASLSRATADVIARLQHPNILSLSLPKVGATRVRSVALQEQQFRVAASLDGNLIPF